MSDIATAAPASPASSDSGTAEAPQTVSTSTLPKATAAKASGEDTGTQAGAGGQGPGSSDGDEGAKAKAAEKAAELYDLVVDGEKRQYTREQLIARAQKTEAAQKRFQEAAEQTKRNQRLLEMISQDPDSALAELGVDLDTLAQRRLAAKAEDALLTPEQRELRDTKAKLARYEQEQEQGKAKALEAQRAQQRGAFEQHVEREFVQAAQKHGLEQHPSSLEMMVEVAVELHELGLDPTADEIAQEAKERLEQMVSKRDAKVAAGLTGEKLLSYLGQKTVDAVLQASLAKLRGAPAAAAPKTAAAQASSNGKRDATYISPAEWRKSYSKSR